MSARSLRYLWALAFSYAFMGVSAAQPPTDNGRFAVEIRSAGGLGPSNVTAPEHVTIPDANKNLSVNSFEFDSSD
jgi:hypothetical protein